MPSVEAPPAPVAPALVAPTPVAGVEQPAPVAAEPDEQPAPLADVEQPTPVAPTPVAGVEPPAAVAAEPAALSDAPTPAPLTDAAEQPAPARRRGGLRERLAADEAAAQARRSLALRRRLPVLLVALLGLTLAVGLVRDPALRAVARRDPAGRWGGWAIEQLAARSDASSFDLYVRQLGLPDSDHALYNRLVFQLGGRRALPADEDGALLDEDAATVREHAAALRAGLAGDPVALRGTLYALWVLKDRAWARDDALLVAAADGLSSPDPVTRRYAAMVLKASPAPAAAQEALVRALATDPDAVVRKNAVEALGAGGDAARAPAALAALDDPHPEVRRAATLALARLGAPPPLGHLEELLRRDDPTRREEVLEAMARHPDERATRVLLDALRDPAARTRRAAAAALGLRPVDAAREGLVAALRDVEPAVRVEAAAALSTRADGRAAVPALVAALPAHESWGELNELHEALRTLTGAEIAGPGPEPATWAAVVGAWERHLAEREGRSP